MVKPLLADGDTMPYRNRHKGCSQNVLAVCDFDFKFLHVLAGWEGSAHDARILKHTLDERGFDIPTPLYYLGDAEY